MKPSSFVMYTPTSVDQAVVMLADVADQDGRVLAGGQTLIPAMALRFAQPAYLIDINNIEALHALEATDEHLRIHACVRHAAFHQVVAPGVLGQLLNTVVQHIAHLPIRSRGTFCGSLANADPSSEWCLVAATLDGVMTAQNMNGAREIPAAEFFLSYMTTALQADDLLTSVRLPLLKPATVFGFEEFSRRAGDFAQAMALVVMDQDGEGLRNVRIGLGGAEEVPRRQPQAEALLEGQPPSPERYAQAARCVAEAIQPMDTTEEAQNYRRHLAETIVLRALEKALPSRG